MAPHYEMRLPSATKAVVERRKIVDYLLNPSHPDNGGKAQFFDKLGFHRKEWKVLAEALRTLAGEAEVAQRMRSSHGQKYVIIGRIESGRKVAAGANDLDRGQR